MSLRLIFMGTPDFAVPTLVELVGGGHEIVAVYTRPPKPAGRRGLELTPSPVAREAERFNIPVFTPKTLREPNAVATMQAHGADAAVVVAYGLILPKTILEIFRLGCFNLHASLPPRWRGAAPIHRAVMAGDGETGVRVMRMDEGLDTGPIAKGSLMAIGRDATTGDLHDALARAGASLMTRAMSALKREHPWKFHPQSKRRVTYANKIDKTETPIDWQRPWQDVHNHCRGLSPFPGAWCEFPDVGRVKILRTTKGDGSGLAGCVLDDRLTIACGDGAVRFIELQRAGGKPMTTEEFLRGTPIKAGSQIA